MALGTEPAVVVAPRVIRARSDQLFWWTDHLIWRAGPHTPDGRWMVRRWGSGPTAVRLVWDEDAPSRTAREFSQALDDACVADKTEAIDAYLTRLTLASEIPTEELQRLRDSVRAGKTGGAADGAPRKRTRKQAAS